MKNLILLFLILSIAQHSFGKDFKLRSPDHRVEVVIRINSGISMTANFLSQELFSVEDIYLDVEGENFRDAIRHIGTEQTNSKNQLIYPEIKEKYGEIQDNFNELTLDFKSNYSLTIRAYNNGLAYRFNTTFQEDVLVNKENFSLLFATTDSIILQKSTTFNSSYETPYEHSAVKDVTKEGYACLPALVKKENGTNIIVTESDLVNYPGLWLKATGTTTMISAFPGYPVSFKMEGSPYVHGQVKEHAGFIAKVEGNRSYP